ncbi:HAD family hydrolase [Novosphingobium sp.]|uniref:HAD family hydrolase n=1 Tax=Novosphingobium sp. TaxID=1874826 RepID=UPI002FDE5DD8
MSRPLVVSDCDEVLLHMVAPYKAWLAEHHDVEFSMRSSDFSDAMRHRGDARPVAPAEIHRLLDLFFDTQMHAQPPIAGAVEAVNALAERADVVILTNLTDAYRDARTAQLDAVGIKARVFTNQGPKGPALQRILDEYRPSRAVFIDDLPFHHRSAAEMTPDVVRLHLCGEPMLAPHIPCAHTAGHAHARIDTWDHALPWIHARLDEAA